MKKTRFFSTLLMSSITVATNAQADWPSTDPVIDSISGELIVKMKPTTNSGIQQMAAAPLGFQMQRIVDTQSVVEKIKSQAGHNGMMAQGFMPVISDADIFDQAYQQMPQEQQALYDFYKVSVPVGMSTDDIIADLAHQPGYEYAEPNYIYHSFYTPDDPSYSQQWSHITASAEQAWDIERGDSNIVVAILDSGVDYLHEDLADNIWRDSNGNPGKDFVDINIDDMIATGYYRKVTGEDYTDIDNDPMDIGGHGTHCAGIVAAVDNDKGVIGIAPNVQIMPIRAGYVLEKLTLSGDWTQSGGLTTDAIIQGIAYAAQQQADVLSMSFGGSNRSKAMLDAFTSADQSGVVLIAAAGNSNSSTPSYPAAYDNVIAVTSVGPEKARARYSNYGIWVDVAAPGGDFSWDTKEERGILSTVPGGYDIYQGTSMAAPYAAGVAALILSHNNTLTNKQIRTVLTSAVDPISQSPYIGTGSINAAKAVSLAENPPSEFIAQLTGPTKALATTTLVPITGIANGTSYSLYYGKGYSPETWTQFASGNGSLEDRELGQFDFAVEGFGAYTIKLVVITDEYQEQDIIQIGYLDGIQSGWEQATHNNIDMRGFSPVIADLNSDGVNEVIVAGGTSVYVFNADGSLYSSNWPIDFAEQRQQYIQPMVSVGDVSGDDKFEIIVKESSTPYISVYSDTGSLLSTTDLNEVGLANVPVLADLNQDGKNEIIIYNGDNYYSNTNSRPAEVYIFNGALTQQAHWVLDNRMWTGGIIASDLDNNGSMEIITLSISNEVELQSIIEAWDTSGALLWQKRFAGSSISQELISHDFDSSGNKALLFSIRQNFEPDETYLLDHLGNTLPGWPVSIPDASVAQLADIDNDGISDIILNNQMASGGQMGDGISILNYHGELIRSFSVEAEVTQQFTIADIDGDPGLEVVINSNELGTTDWGIGTDSIFAYNLDDGSPVAGFPKRLFSFPNYRVFNSSPAIADIDSDGDLEIFTGQIGLRVFDLPAQVDLNKLVWGQLQNNPSHNGDIIAKFASAYSSVYFKGTASDWAAQRMSLVADNSWQIEVTFGNTPNERFKFDIHGDWSLNFGNDNDDMIADQNGDDITISQGAGTYIITFNDVTKEYSVTKQALTDGSVNINYNGRFGIGYLLHGLEVTLYRYGQVYDHYLISREAHGSAVTRIADLPEGDYKLELHQFKDDKWVLGSVEFELDKTNKRFSSNVTAIESNVEHLYFRGTANNWLAQEMTLTATNTWKIDATFNGGDDTGSDRFKFDLYGDWSVNYGDNNNDQIADLAGTDIAVNAAGDYEITFNSQSNAYSVITK